MEAYELNFDGLVGASHNYAGLSVGNIASEKNKNIVSSPKKAALQGLEKMKTLYDLGLKQAVLVPHERPNLHIVRELGYLGTDEDILTKLYQEKLELFAALCSASAMWTANAATISPSADSFDNKVHFTTANLTSKFHRSIEAPLTQRVLAKIFDNPKYFIHHKALSNKTGFGDEGAANHNRLSARYGDKGVEIFVYGKDGIKYKARQGFEASKTIAFDYHSLDKASVVLAEQNPHVIDQGVFHNDVISVANQNVFLYHEEAFTNSDLVIKEIKTKFNSLENSSTQLHLIKVTNKMLSVEEAVNSYLFNSQLVTLAKTNDMLIIAPSECKSNSRVKNCINEILKADNPIKDVKYMDLKQSMQNGGGPACLRLRVVLTEEELQHINQAVIFTEDLYLRLRSWIEKYYRDELQLADMLDPLFLTEMRSGLDELSSILKLGNIYDFQM